MANAMGNSVDDEGRTPSRVRTRNPDEQSEELLQPAKKFDNRDSLIRMRERVTLPEVEFDVAKPENFGKALAALLNGQKIIVSQINDVNEEIAKMKRDYDKKFAEYDAKFEAYDKALETKSTITIKQVEEKIDNKLEAVKKEMKTIQNMLPAEKRVR